MTLRETSKPAPLYERVKQHVLDRVNRGEWTDGTRLPSELEFVEALGVSRMTVHRALRELSAEGLISRIQGVGSFVAPRQQRTGLLEIRDIAEEIISHGHRHRAQVVKLEAVRTAIDLAAAFDLRPGAKVFHSLIVHHEDDRPVQLEERWVTPHFSPVYLDQDFEVQTTNRYLQNIAPATELEQTVFAVTPDAEACRLLEIDAGEPCLLLSRRTWVGSTPATKSLFTYPGSRYSLGSRYKVANGAPR